MLRQALDQLLEIERDHAQQFPNEFPLFEETLQVKLEGAKCRIKKFQALVQMVGNMLSSFVGIIIRSDVTQTSMI